VNTPSQLDIIPHQSNPRNPICDFCFHAGDVHIEDYRDSLGHDVKRYGCDDIKGCLERQARDIR